MLALRANGLPLARYGKDPKETVGFLIYNSEALPTSFATGLYSLVI